MDLNVAWAACTHRVRQRVDGARRRYAPFVKRGVSERLTNSEDTRNSPAAFLKRIYLVGANNTRHVLEGSGKRCGEAPASLRPTEARSVRGKR